VDSAETGLDHWSVLCSDIFRKAQNITLITTSTMALLPSMKHLVACLLSGPLLMSCQQPTAMHTSKVVQKAPCLSLLKWQVRQSRPSTTKHRVVTLPPTDLLAFGPWFCCQVGHNRTHGFIVDSFIRNFVFDPSWCLWGFDESGAHCRGRNHNHHGRPCSSNSLVTYGCMTSHATHRVFCVTKQTSPTHQARSNFNMSRHEQHSSEHAISL
jgi:hypothetical protein